jgi:uncharacterized RDD family membrane protein YckC
MVMKERMTPEEVEVRVWAFIVICIMVMLTAITLGILWAVTFEEQSMELAPIDAIFLEILKAVAYMSIGTLGGIAGRKVTKAIAEEIAKKDEGES